jgi:glycosyltransferase involved in cell wall biosynthesis
MRELRERYGRKVFLDLCDYVTHPRYGNNSGELRRVTILSQVPYIDAIVVPTEQLRKVLSASLSDAIPIIVIPDQAESSALIERTRVFSAKKVDVYSQVELRRLIRPRARLIALKSRIARTQQQARESLLSFRMLVADLSRAPRSLPTRLHQKLRNSWASRPRTGASPATTGRNKMPADQGRVSGPNGGKTLIWFGNAGSDSFQSGVQTLTLIASDLIRLAQTVDFELVVMSSRSDAYKTLIEPLPFRSRFELWSQEGCFEAVRASDAFLMPQIEDEFSECKSANRALLALSCGTPVIASRLLSLAPLKDCIVTDDWEGGFRRYLLDETATKADLEKARSIIENEFSAEATGRKWLELMGLEKSRPAKSPQVTIFFHLLQDIHVLLPVVTALVARAAEGKNGNSYDVDVVLLKSVYLQQPDIVREIVSTGARLRLLKEDTDEDNLRALDVKSASVLIVGAETSLRPHRLVHAAVLKANELGIPTISMQHGLEAPGLSYFDDRHTSDVKIASLSIFTYGDPARLPKQASSDLVQRCIPVGRFAPSTSRHLATLQSSLEAINPRRLPVIAIFENLHWHRYEADDYRGHFSAHIERLVDTFKDVFFVIKPHPAGVWLQKNPRITTRANTFLLRRDDPGLAGVTAADLLSVSQAVITTPSTVAVDATQLCRPVLVFANTLDLPLFEPLEIGRSYDDIEAFVTRALDGSATMDAVSRFKSSALAAGNVASNIVCEIDRLLEDRTPKPPQNKHFSE